MAPKNRYSFGLSPLLQRDTAARERMLESTGGIPEEPEMDYKNFWETVISPSQAQNLPYVPSEDDEQKMQVLPYIPGRDSTKAEPAVLNYKKEFEKYMNSRLAEDLGKQALTQPDVTKNFNPFLTPEEIKRRLAEKNKPVLPTDIEVQEPLPEASEITPELAARVAREGTVRMSPQMARANLLPQENTPEVDVVAAQFPTPSLLGGQELSLGGGQAQESLPPETTAPVAPPAAPGTTKAPGAQPTRLEQLAKIISMTGGAEMAPEDKRRAALVDAIGKAQQAMYAGVTRSALPATFFQQAATEQTPMNRLEQLYKASQILGQPKELVDPGLIADLRRRFPDAKTIPDELTTTQFRELSKNLENEAKEKGRSERAKATLEQAQKQHEDRMTFAEKKLGEEKWKFITNEIGDKQKQVAGIQAAMPALEKVVNESLAAFNLPGGEAIRALRLGQFTPDQEQMWNIVFEQLISGERKELFGATLTGNELAAFNTMVGLGASTNTAQKLKALALLVERMHTRMKGAFGNIENTPAFQEYRAATGDLTHLNPIWSAFDENLKETAKTMPKAGEAAAQTGKRLYEIGQKAVKGATGFVEGVMGKEAPKAPPTTPTFFPTTPATTPPVTAPTPPAQQDTKPPEPPKPPKPTEPGNWQWGYSKSQKKWGYRDAKTGVFKPYEGE